MSLRNPNISQDLLNNTRLIRKMYDTYLDREILFLKRLFT